ncbi:oligosaccharide biosynthesis protein Alg14-like protein, partial [Tirmania nivea]
LRLLSILPSTNPTSPPPRTPKSPTHLAAVLGSGGHTSEALLLLSTVDFSKLTYRTYIVSSGDSLSAQKARDFEVSRAPSPGSFTIKVIPRARKIGQSWLSTPATCLRCFLSCLVAVGGGGKGGVVDVVVCNGPGSAVMVVGACLWYKFWGAKTRTIYVESFARVKTLSLSGSILYWLVDRFIVQWPGLKERYSRAEYHGILV